MDSYVGWAQVMTIIGANLAAFMWARKEAGDDRRLLTNLLIEMKDEMKDFHARMAVIEDRRRKK